jgi:hypothetical protein
MGNVNQDGDLDLLLTGDSGLGNPTTSLYFGDGNGSFEKADVDLTGVFVSSSSVTDVNGDGHPDLLITGSADLEPQTIVYLGNGRRPAT